MRVALLFTVLLLPAGQAIASATASTPETLVKSFKSFGRCETRLETLHGVSRQADFTSAPDWKAQNINGSYQITKAIERSMQRYAAFAVSAGHDTATRGTDGMIRGVSYSKMTRHVCRGKRLYTRSDSINAEIFVKVPD